LSASAPYVIAPVELIVVLYKNTWKKTSGSKVSDILRQDFMDWTNGLWSFSGESKKRIGHPAPFPVELPKRCMKLFSFKGDTVLDPFLGSGTTLVASYLNDRKGIGIDIDPHYCKIALDRLKKEGGMGQTNITQYVTPTNPKLERKKSGATQTDTIFQFFKDNPSRSITYDDVGEWINQESEKNSVTEIKSYEKIMRSLAKDGKITKIDKGIFKYE
jgi:hypothetical protein